MKPPPNLLSFRNRRLCICEPCSLPWQMLAEKRTNRGNCGEVVAAACEGFDFSIQRILEVEMVSCELSLGKCSVKRCEFSVERIGSKSSEGHKDHLCFWPNGADQNPVGATVPIDLERP